MSEWLDSSGVLQTGYDLIRGLLLLIAGGVLALLLSRLARRIVTERFTPAQAEVTGRLVLWGVLGLSVVSALREVGFDDVERTLLSGGISQLLVGTRR